MVDGETPSRNVTQLASGGNGGVIEPQTNATQAEKSAACTGEQAADRCQKIMKKI